jgi:hypothetical protein
MLNRDDAIRTAALLAIAETYNAVPVYVKNRDAMRLHTVGVELGLPLCFAQSTGLTACSELNYALNRIDSYTAAAMVAEMQRCMAAAERYRAQAAAWTVYFEDAVRNERAQAEDDDRVAQAEAADFARIEQY